MNWLKERKYKLLLYAGITSTAGLVILFGIRIYAPTLLDIDIKWLAAISVPILLALIAGKFITKVKLMGVDVEIAAQDRVIDHEEIIQIFHGFAVLEKSNVEILDLFTLEDRKKPNVLEFVQARNDYYQAGAIAEYLRRLPRVQFFLIRNIAGDFVALLVIERERFLDPSFEVGYDFIGQLSSGIIPKGLGYQVIIGRITTQTRIIDAYYRFRHFSSDIMAVFENENSKEPIGYVTLQMIEKYLAGLLAKNISAIQKDV